MGITQTVELSPPRKRRSKSAEQRKAEEQRKIRSFNRRVSAAQKKLLECLDAMVNGRYLGVHLDCGLTFREMADASGIHFGVINRFANKRMILGETNEAKLSSFLARYVYYDEADGTVLLLVDPTTKKKLKQRIRGQYSPGKDVGSNEATKEASPQEQLHIRACDPNSLI